MARAAGFRLSMTPAPVLFLPRLFAEAMIGALASAGDYQAMPRSLPEHLIRIPDQGVTESLVTFADRFLLDRALPSSRVLDIGCGRGVFCENLAPRVRSVLGIDLVASEIAHAQRHSRQSNATYLCQDAEYLQALPGTFDLILSRFCFHHLDLDAAAPGIKARLRPGGRLLVVDCYQEFWSLAGRLYVMRSALEQLGGLRMLALLPRLLYFFDPKRVQHVVEDKRRLKRQRRYRYDELAGFYQRYFPDARIERLGCAFSLDWRKPSRPVGGELFPVGEEGQPGIMQAN